VFESLKERKLVQWAVAYLAAAYVVFQGIEVLAEPWGITPALQRGLHILLLVGLFITGILAWFHGEKGRQRVSGPELLMVAVVLFVAGLVLSTVMAPDEEEAQTGNVRSGTREDGRPSIAVLVCDNFSPDPNDAYLAPGLHDEILLRLSRISALKSIGRTSVLRFATNPPATEVIAQELGVDFVGECSVTKAEDRLRLTFQLLDGDNGSQVWADHFDNSLTMANLLGIYSEIAEEVAARVGAVLTSEEKGRIGAGPTGGFEAYDLYLRGRQSHFTWEEEGLNRAVDYFAQAIDRDPHWALPYAAQAESYWQLSFVSSANPSEHLSRARTAAERAVELDPTFGDPLAILAAVRMIEEYDWVEAGSEFARAVELSPGSYTSHLMHGSFFLNAVGEQDLAEGEVRFCMELDPLNIAPGLELAWVYFVGRKHDDAIRQIREGLEVDPNYPMGVALLGLSLEQLSAFDEAVESLERAVGLSPGKPFFGVLLARGYAAAGRGEEAREILSELSSNWPQEYTTPYYMAAAYAALGENDLAFEWLQRAFEVRDPWLVFANRDPVLDGLRLDPRFRDLLRRLNFPANR